MNTSNSDLVAEFYKALNKKDIEAAALLLHGKISIVQLADVPWRGSFTGVGGFMEFSRKLIEAITPVAEVEEYVETGNNVVAIGRTHGTANSSGKSFDIRFVHVWEIADHKLSRFEVYIDSGSMLLALDQRET